MRAQDRHEVPYWQKPGNGCEAGEADLHLAQDAKDVGIFSPVAELVRALAEGQAFHDIKGKEIKPPGHVHGLVSFLLDPHQQLVDRPCELALIAEES